MIPFPIFLGSNITEGQISRVKPPPEAFTEANYGESGSELLTADVRTNQAKTGGMHGDEWCAVNLAKDGRSEIGAAGDALTILIKFKCVARFALVRFNKILVCL